MKTAGRGLGEAVNLSDKRDEVYAQTRQPEKRNKTGL